MNRLLARHALAGALFAPLAAICGCTVLRPPSPLPALTREQRTRTFTRDEAAADLDSLLALLEEIHPNPYTIVSRDSMHRLERAIVADLPEHVSRLTLSIPAQRLFSAVGDAHTTIYPPSEELNFALAAGRTSLPFGVVGTEVGWTVGASIDTLLHSGDQLVRINGHDVDSLAGDFALEVPAELAAWRTARIAGSFATRLWAHGVRAPYLIDVRRAVGGLVSVTVPGASKTQLDSLRAVRATSAPSRAGITYRALGGRVAYLDFQSMEAPVDLFAHVVDSLFDRVNADSSIGVIVDLRGNGGGNSALGDRLLSYVTNRNYVAGIRKDWKMSKRYRAYFASQVTPWIRWLPFSWLGPQGHRLFGPPDGTIVSLTLGDSIRPGSNARRIARPFCVLIGPGTFSSAMLLANEIKQSRLGTLIGEPTGEAPNSFGEAYAFRLGLSGLQGQISSAAFILDADPAARAHGVLPDVVVTRTVADVAAGRDPALDRARQCAAREIIGAIEPSRGMIYRRSPLHYRR